MEGIRLVSLDLNGTLVHQHTMQDMLRIFFPEEPQRYLKARAVFSDQTSGKLSIREAFETAGPLTRGLTLRQAIDYVRKELRFLDGFSEFIERLHQVGCLVMINSTGYSVTLYAIRYMIGEEKIQETIGQELVFGLYGDPERALQEEELASMVKTYLLDPKASRLRRYDELRATGRIKLVLNDEAAKADFVFRRTESLGIPSKSAAHIGDSIGDSEAIRALAESGGLGIAFNYNQALAHYLKGVVERKDLAGRVLMLDSKGGHADLRHLLPHLL